MRSSTLALSALLALLLAAPLAVASGPQTYPACVARVTAPSCFGGYDVCSPYASLQRPACANYPACPHTSCFSTGQKQIVCIEGSSCGESGMLVCVNTQPKPCVPDPCATANCFNANSAPEHAQCTALVGSGAAAAGCVVNGKNVGPIATCQYCMVLFYEACTVGTEGTSCWSHGLNMA